MKVLIWIVSLFVFLTLIVFIFWNQEVKYLLPTPKPKNIVQLKNGDKAPVHVLGLDINSNKNLLVHFYNPNCPCTKFNMNEIKLLSFEYKDDVELVVVAQTKNIYEGLEQEIQSQFLHPIKVVLDKSGSIAKAFGIYASPQMVLVDKQLTVVYSGNYNISRYCTSKKTAFGKQSLEYLVQNAVNENLEFLKGNQLSYGCLLPSFDNQ